MPRVSVVMIFWNAERFLAEAVESVLAQRYPDWELLLVDDGSTDGSPVIAQRYAHAQPERVRYLTRPDRGNRGMSASRNLGVAQARGEYVAFLDADDVWFPTTLEQQVQIMDEHPALAMVYGPLYWWYSWTGKAGDSNRDFIEDLGVPADSIIEPPHLLSRFLCDRAAVPSGVLVRRSVIDRLGGFEEAFRGEYEDQVFCAKVCLHETVFASSKCWYRYRQHPESAVSVGHASGTTQAARLAFLNWLAGYLDSQGVMNSSVRHALQLEFWRFSRPRLYRILKRGQHLERRIRKHAKRMRAVAAAKRGSPGLQERTWSDDKA